MTEKPHYWSRCPMCGPCVTCGKCGNSACNAMYGTLADGTTCDRCPSAYEMQGKEEGLPLWGRALHWWAWVCAYARMLRPHSIGWRYWRWRGMPGPRPWWTFRK